MATQTARSILDASFEWLGSKETRRVQIAMACLRERPGGESGEPDGPRPEAADPLAGIIAFGSEPTDAITPDWVAMQLKAAQITMRKRSRKGKCNLEDEAKIAGYSIFVSAMREIYCPGCPFRVTAVRTGYCCWRLSVGTTGRKRRPEYRWVIEEFGTIAAYMHDVTLAALLRAWPVPWPVLQAWYSSACLQRPANTGAPDIFRYLFELHNGDTKLCAEAPTIVLKLAHTTLLRGGTQFDKYPHREDPREPNVQSETSDDSGTQGPWLSRLQYFARFPTVDAARNELTYPRFGSRHCCGLSCCASEPSASHATTAASAKIAAENAELKQNLTRLTSDSADLAKRLGAAETVAQAAARTMRLALTRIAVLEKRECPVCLAEFEPDAAASTLKCCLTTFHDACIGGWKKRDEALGRTPGCPTCQAPLEGAASPARTADAGSAGSGVASSSCSAAPAPGDDPFDGLLGLSPLRVSQVFNSRSDSESGSEYDSE